MFKKIDYFFNGKYHGSTNSFKTCKDAKEKLLKNYKNMIEKNVAGYSDAQLGKFKEVLNNPEKLKAFFDK